MTRNWIGGALGALALVAGGACASAYAADAYVVTVDYTAPHEAITELKTLIEGVAKASIAEPGCSRFDVVLPADGSDHVTLFEVFDDEAAFKAHAKTDAFKQFVADSTKIGAKRTAVPGRFLLSLKK